MIVCKFGGSSVAEASQILKVKNIFESDPERVVIVVSAPGKRNSNDEKITDLLYRCAAEAEADGKAGSFGIIRKRYDEICASLGIDPISSVLDEVEQKINAGAGPDYAASRGEYLAARMLSGFFGAEFIDAADVIHLTEDGRVDSRSYSLLKEKIKPGHKYILPGFFGSDPRGKVKTFSRGGSDITGAIAARAIEADKYENWTDVSGILMADPRIVENPAVVKELTYKEIRELASIGANVFHEEAIAPVRNHDIPINIRNTNDPEAPGTMIVSSRDSSSSPVVGISGKKGYRQIYVEKLMLNRYPEFREKFLKTLRKFNIIPEFESMGFDSISFLAPESQCGDLKAAFDELTGELGPEVLEDRRTMGLIGVVGSGITGKPGIAASVFEALRTSGINVRFISYGGSEIAIVVGVDPDDYLPALKSIHGAFAV